MHVGRRAVCLAGLVEGRPRDAATCGRPRSGSHLGGVARGARQATGGWDDEEPIDSIEMEEGPCVLQATGGWGCDPSALAAIPAADFARVVRASRGAHCRPLHPRLASLCSAQNLFMRAEGPSDKTAWKNSTETASRDRGRHSNSEPRQPGIQQRFLVSLQEEFPRRDRGYLRPPICPATFCKPSYAPVYGAPSEVSRGTDRGDRSNLRYGQFGGREERDTLEATGLSYPIGSGPDRPCERRDPRE